VGGRGDVQKTGNGNLLINGRGSIFRVKRYKAMVGRSCG